MCGYSSAVMKNSGETVSDIARKFFFAGLPDGVTSEIAVNAIRDFYTEGLAPGYEKKTEKQGDDREHSAPRPPCFDFEEDEGYFYAAFLSEYGIDLNCANLHWFDFCALFRGLPDECKLKRIIGIRSENLNDIKSSAEKARIRRLKRVFALKVTAVRHYDSAEDRNEAMKRAAERRSEEARRKMKGGRK